MTTTTTPKPPVDAATTVAATTLVAAATTPTQPWRQYARCLGADPEIFYPSCDEAAAEAKAICMICPVREPCLEHAISAREKQGVWGGLTERERRRLVRQRRRLAERLSA
jgi:WhiB family transcriptional regulator, redox-sensing transcriptional regulator